MPQRADSFDIGRLRLTAGEARSLDLAVPIEPLVFATERYEVQGGQAAAGLEVSRTTGHGHVLRLRFEVALRGPCMRCLGSAAPRFAVDAREVDQPGSGEELESPYVDRELLDLRAWARDALALALPAQILCRPECAGLCPECGADLNLAGPEHEH